MEHNTSINMSYLSFPGRFASLSDQKTVEAIKQGKKVYCLEWDGLGLLPCQDRDLFVSPHV